MEELLMMVKSFYSIMKYLLVQSELMNNSKVDIMVCCFVCYVRISISAPSCITTLYTIFFGHELIIQIGTSI